jgi:2-oxoglutarate ferredoxin oxidoreductase subunit beta
MVSVEDFGSYETAWCPGCGNFALRKALTRALAEMDLAPHKLCLVTGIGQAAKMPQYVNANFFTGLHGRSLPPAQAVKLANPGLTVIAESGDGCSFGEGGNHFLAAVRRNVDITLISHDNQIYGLTKGQASPTTQQGHKTKAQPFGAPSTAFNPVAAAVAMRASFVARGFVGEEDHLVELIDKAVNHKGFALLDVFQPCVSFNRVNTHKWYKERCYKLGEDYDPTDWGRAVAKAAEFGDRIPLGVLYTEEKPDFASQLPFELTEPMAGRAPDMDAVARIMDSHK